MRWMMPLVLLLLPASSWAISFALSCGNACGPNLVSLTAPATCVLSVIQGSTEEPTIHVTDASLVPDPGSGRPSVELAPVPAVAEPGETATLTGVIEALPGETTIPLFVYVDFFAVYEGVPDPPAPESFTGPTLTVMSGRGHGHTRRCR